MILTTGILLGCVFEWKSTQLLYEIALFAEFENQFFDEKKYNLKVNAQQVGSIGGLVGLWL